MQPINYNVEIPDITGNFLQGYQQARALQNQFQADQRQSQTYEQLADIRQNGATPQNLQALMLSAPEYANIAQSINNQMAEQAKLLMQEKKKQAFQNDFTSLLNNPSATLQDYSILGAKHPDFEKEAQDTWKNLGEEKRKNTVQQILPVVGALENKNSDFALKQLNKYKEGYLNSGDQQGAAQMDQYIDLINANPTAAAWYGRTLLNGAQDIKELPAAMEKSQEMVFKQELQPSAKSKAEADATEASYKSQAAGYLPQKAAVDIKNTEAATNNFNSMIKDRAARLGLDEEKLRSEASIKMQELEQKRFEFSQKQTELTPDARKIINDSTIEAAAAEQSATQMLSLADRFSKQRSIGGVAGKGWEGLKRLVGGEDGLTALRNEYVQTRNSELLKILPTGNTSDKDIIVFMNGFLPENANDEQTEGWLRGRAKAAQITAFGASSKADWVNNVGHLGKAKNDMMINGIPVAAGTMYSQFFAKNYKKSATSAEVKANAGAKFMNYAGGNNE